MKPALHAIRALRLPDSIVQIEDKDAILYALSLGVGAEGIGPFEMRYLYERDAEPFPTMPVVLGHPGPWADAPALGLDRSRFVHGSQRLALHAPVPIGRALRVSHRIVDVIDKGEGRAAVLHLRKSVQDAERGDLLATCDTETYCRGQGGFGGPSEGGLRFAPVPAGAPDYELTLEVPPTAAALYRLNGDRTLLHIDPEVAARAGFSRPILHGLCSLGMVAQALLRDVHGKGRPVRLGTLQARFSHPVLPGDRLRVAVWPNDTGLAFRVQVQDGDAVVLDHGSLGWMAG